MLTKSELDDFRKADICSCNKSDLTDVTTVNVDISESMYSRAEKYFDIVKNPYTIRVGDIGVKINCLGNNDFSRSIINIIDSSK